MVDFLAAGLKNPAISVGRTVAFMMMPSTRAIELDVYLKAGSASGRLTMTSIQKQKQIIEAIVSHSLNPTWAQVDVVGQNWIETDVDDEERKWLLKVGDICFMGDYSASRLKTYVARGICQVYGITLDQLRDKLQTSKRSLTLVGDETCMARRAQCSTRKEWFYVLNCRKSDREYFSGEVAEMPISVRYKEMSVVTTANVRHEKYEPEEVHYQIVLFVPNKPEDPAELVAVRRTDEDHDCIPVRVEELDRHINEKPLTMFSGPASNVSPDGIRTADYSALYRAVTLEQVMSIEGRGVPIGCIPWK